MRKNYNSTIGRLLRYYRETKKMTAQEVADKIGVSRQSINAWESGTRTISAQQMMDYLAVLEVDPDHFIKMVIEL